ncbi:MAG: glycoside hydrolase family 2 [Clostridia bacterium]|nr:glycoside hydrolase family 2 [Clostridia bacterium]
MKTILLNGQWKLSGKRQFAESEKSIFINATVPGDVQLDLCEAGYLPRDIFMGMNVKETEKFEDYEWWYERTFTAPEEKSNVWLVFEAVDCLAEYYLNGVKFGESKNAFISHEFCVDEYLVEGENTLTVHLSSAVLDSFNHDYTIKSLKSPTSTELRHVRKPHHSYSWDIMPRVVTAGLWRGVRLEVRDEVYFSQIFFRNDDTTTRMYYVMECPDRDLSDVEVELEAWCGDDSGTKCRVRTPKRAGYIEYYVKNPKRWWPYGYGEPNVYDGKVRIYRHGELVHEEKISFGMRTVTLEREDRLGGKKGQFRILVNGVEILCKGSNWVPLDPFHSRDAAKYDKALALVSDLRCNILRCWGGNVYEDHTFFDYCDRHGIMVWQDFAMACVPPEDEEFKKNIENEAISVIRKLRNHPSIVIWAGDNECDSCAFGYVTDDNTITREVLPKCVELNDFGRPYIPSSPYITRAEYNAGVRAQVEGSILVEDHLWGPRDYYKASFYTGNSACFVSETGYHGCPSLESIKKFTTPEKVWPYKVDGKYNDEWILHSSDNFGRDYRVKLVEEQVKQLFGYIPENPEDYILASQISQAEADKYFIERIRVGRPEKTGIIWWNVLDGWPQTSDAVVDYYFDKKLAYGYIKRSQAPFIVAAGEIISWGLPIFACNDTLTEKKVHLVIRDINEDKIVHESTFNAPANTSTKIVSLPVYYSDKKFFVFEWEVDGVHGWNHYFCGYPPIDFEEYRRVMKKYNFEEK